jgi:hypothetical protein
VKTEKKIWVLRYSHEYGHDINLYTTEEKATAGLGEILDSYSNELHSACKGATGGLAAWRKFRGYMRQERYWKAADIWMDWREEYFELYERVVN